jgi:hypothetical protein
MEPRCWIYVIVGFGLTSWMPEKCARFTKWLIVLWLSRGMWLWLILSHLSWCVNVLGLATVITSVNLHYTMHALLASLQITWDISCNGLSCPSSYYIVWWQIYSLYGLTGKQWRQLPQPQLQLLHPWPGVHQEDETGGVTVMGHHTRCWACYSLGGIIVTLCLCNQVSWGGIDSKCKKNSLAWARLWK